MNIYFFFGLQSHTLICHEMAKYLYTNYDLINFSGTIAVKGGGNYNYLLKQKDIAYQYIDIIDKIEKDALSYDVSRDQIVEWEKRIDCPLWHLAVADRNIGHAFVKGGLQPRTKMMESSDHENIQKFVCKYLDFFNNRFDVFRPDAVFFIAFASMPALAIAKICQFKKIPFYVLRTTRIKDRYYLSKNDATERFTVIEEEYNRFIRQNNTILDLPAELASYLSSFNTDSPEKPAPMITYLKSLNKIRKRNILKILLSHVIFFIKVIYAKININIDVKDLRYKYPLSVWWLSFRKEFKIRFFNGKAFDKNSCLDEKYIFFPLHMNPEASTMILAPNFVDQLVVIDALAKNIPLYHKLYVKEHVGMIGSRPSHFYKKIKEYPNVRLLSPHEDNFQLIRNADLVAVITGTAGWEALLMRKPVITFGENFYSRLGISEPCSDFNELGKLIKKIIFNFNFEDENEKNEWLKKFLLILYRNSFPLENSILWGRTIPIEKLNEKEIKGAHILARNLYKSVISSNDNDTKSTSQTELN